MGGRGRNQESGTADTKRNKMGQVEFKGHRTDAQN